MTNEFNENRRSKDFWLLFIFADIIAMSFFGFILYKALSEKFFNAPASAPVVAVAVNEEPKPQTPTVIPPPAPVQPAPEPAVKPEPKPQAKPEPAPQTETTAKKEVKESVTVAPGGNSKTRKVTFKYFEDASKVSIISGFTMRKPLALKKKGNVWEGTFVIYPGEYKYLFVVDGVNKLDPNAPEKDGRSVVVIK